MTLEGPDLTGSPGEACPREGLTNPCECAAIMFAGRRTPDAGRRTPDAGRRTPDAGRRTPDAGRRTPDAGRRTPLLASSAWDGSRPLASPPDPNASPDGRCPTSRPPRPVRRASAFSTDGGVPSAVVRDTHPAARRPRRGLVAPLLALPLRTTPRPTVAQIAPRPSAGLTTTPGARQLSLALAHSQPQRHHRVPVFGHGARLAAVPEGHPHARGLHDTVHGGRPERQHASPLLHPERRALRRHLRKGSLATLTQTGHALPEVLARFTEWFFSGSKSSKEPTMAFEKSPPPPPRNPRRVGR